MWYWNKATEFSLHLHCVFNASRSFDIKCAFVLLKKTTLTACNLLGFPADKWSEWGCIDLRVWIWRTCVSAAEVVCRDRWGEEFKNSLGVSLSLWMLAYANWTLKSVKITLEQLDLEFTCYNQNNCIPRLCVCCLYVVIQMNFHCACFLLIYFNFNFLSTTTYPALTCCLY